LLVLKTAALSVVLWVEHLAGVKVVSRDVKMAELKGN
jgi:hypothetical protein